MSTKIAVNEPPVLLADLVWEGANEDDIRRNFEVSKDPLGRAVIAADAARVIARRVQVTQQYISEMRQAWAQEPDHRQTRRRAFVGRAVAAVPVDQMHGSEVAIQQAEAGQRAAREFDRVFPEVGSGAPNADVDEFAWFRRTHPERWQTFREALADIDKERS